jgi:class 3 adenylate cyclase
MFSLEETREEIRKIFKAKWSNRKGLIVPEPENIQLGNHSVELKGTVLYADLKDSTDLVLKYNDEFAAGIYKTYLLSACRLIRRNGGEITAFDGDRVMAVFIGSRKNSEAVKTALMINYMVVEVINKEIKSCYPNIEYLLQQAVGIDTSHLFVARTGIRGSNDLVWVGRAANYAAKLCSLRQGLYSTFITRDVFLSMADDVFCSEEDIYMWEESWWADRQIPVYKSSWWWRPY